MNKQDLINYVSADTGLSKADAKRAVESVFDNIKTALGKADTAQFIGFGTFRVEHREAREGRNPQTGEPMQISAKNVVKFKAGKELADAV